MTTLKSRIMRAAELSHPECLNDEAKTLDEYIFDYFNNAYPDEVAALIDKWEANLERVVGK